ncbi:hypothetical protein KQX54_019978 [Cotesia glomerata]|uniref:Uncharacterized protein n=1 Tax=Cotesia glomerata TaxID=32391 RepID=A0AAV7HZB2_COTGL|nr:hypothetical protein KQX54_019978 [Cotesia glomerata]
MFQVTSRIHPPTWSKWFIHVGQLQAFGIPPRTTVSSRVRVVCFLFSRAMRFPGGIAAAAAAAASPASPAMLQSKGVVTVIQALTL